MNRPLRLRGFRQMAAAVRAQVHDQAVDAAFGLELLDEASDVARGARVVVVAAAARGEVLVEARYRDDADAVVPAVERVSRERPSSPLAPRA